MMQFDTASPKGRAHIEEYLQNAAANKKELDKELNASLIDSTLLIKSKIQSDRKSLYP